MDNDSTSGAGRHAEQIAARFLEKRALSVIERNYRCKVGEIDLICKDGASLVFVEVRLRKNSAFGGAAASITPDKQRKIARAAQHYLTAKRKIGVICRFDCVVLDSLDKNSVEWIRNAFFAE
ncbi:MAG: YraN family protein [Candidatus Accumulibacter sp.]|jgi:putative endonuclease|nr:YraN family protein [Accumulibacter sp.]